MFIRRSGCPVDHGNKVSKQASGCPVSHESKKDILLNAEVIGEEPLSVCLHVFF